MILVLGSEVSGIWFRVWFKVQGQGFGVRIWVSGFGVYGPGCMAQGSGF